MAHSRNWNNSSPVDHTLNKSWPGEDRKVRVDVDERLKDQQYGFTSGETNDGIKRLEFREQAADPGAGADVFRLYGKESNSKAELFGQDEDGNVIQITKAGKIIPSQSAVLADWATIMALVYPVGFVITLGVSTNPATLLGVGTWTAITDKVIVGKAGSGTFDTLDATGGAETHALTEAELATHDHPLTMYNSNGGGNAGIQESSATGGSGAQNTGNAGSGDAHNNLQPYIVKYVWQRTA